MPSVRRAAKSTIAIWSASLALGAGAADLAPLSPTEQALLVDEIRAMIRTDERQVKRFVVMEATPERIERAFATPAFLAQPKNVRENGLIFAGQGSLLAFDKPSDVIAKVERWFPLEVAAARGSKSQSFFSHLHLYGPFPDWQVEPAAFLALWNCLPRIAWLKPRDDPFARRLNDSLPMLPTGARSSSPEEFEFGYCVRERNGYISARTQAELPELAADRRAIAQRVVPWLRQYVATFLAAHGCRNWRRSRAVAVWHCAPRRIRLALDLTQPRSVAARRAQAPCGRVPLAP